jgi:hypothetical protein
LLGLAFLISEIARRRRRGGFRADHLERLAPPRRFDLLALDCEDAFQDVAHLNQFCIAR